MCILTPYSRGSLNHASGAGRQVKPLTVHVLDELHVHDAHIHASLRV